MYIFVRNEIRCSTRECKNKQKQWGRHQAIHKENQENKHLFKKNDSFSQILSNYFESFTTILHNWIGSIQHSFADGWITLGGWMVFQNCSFLQKWPMAGSLLVVLPTIL